MYRYLIILTNNNIILTEWNSKNSTLEEMKSIAYSLNNNKSIKSWQIEYTRGAR